MNLGLIQSVCLQAACDAGLPTMKSSPVEGGEGSSAAEHLWKCCKEEDSLPWAWGKSRGPRILVCWFEPAVGGTDLLGKLSPGRGDIEPVAQVDDMALEKQGGRISCW